MLRKAPRAPDRARVLSRFVVEIAVGVVVALASGAILAVGSAALDWAERSYLFILIVAITNGVVAVLIFATVNRTRARLPSAIRTIQRSTGSMDIPTLRPASAGSIATLEARNPLDLGLLNRWISALGPGTGEIRIPSSKGELDTLPAFFRSTVESFSETISRGITDEQARATIEACEYLMCQERWPTPPSLHSLNVVVVAGARGSGIEGRAASARWLYQFAANPPLVIASGSGPPGGRTGPSSEADAIRYFLCDSGHPGLRIPEDHVLVDSGSADTEGTILAAKRLIRARFGALDSRREPLNMVFVAGPYSLRRVYLLANYIFGHDYTLERELEIAVYPGQTDVGLVTIMDHERPREAREKAVRRWLNEYFKLVGGRAAGEF